VGKESRGASRSRHEVAADTQGQREWIVIASRELRAEPGSVAAVREAARIRASAAPPVEASLSHPVIRRTLAALRKAAPAHTGLVTVDARVGLATCEVAKASLDRLEGILAGIANNPSASASRGACQI